MENEESSDTEDLGFMTSEAGMDQQAQKEAETIRFETEQRLAQTDEIMIWRLDDWRQPLATLQDMMVQLAGVGTGGGTWVGHEMQRNDLTLEENLLSLHADALAADSYASSLPDASRTRAKAWQSLWAGFETTAETLRASPEIDDIWKSHLDSTLKEARTAHDSLAVMLGSLKDDEAAQAVIEFSEGYFSELRDMFQIDDPGTGH